MFYVIKSERDNSLFEGWIWGGVPCFGWDLQDAKKFDSYQDAEEIRRTLRDTTTRIIETNQEAINNNSIL